MQYEAIRQVVCVVYFYVSILSVIVIQSIFFYNNNIVSTILYQSHGLEVSRMQ